MKKYKYFVISFLLMFIICLLTPISGDDYGNYISTSGKLYEAISIAKSYYYSWEGRFVGRILIMFTTYHKFIWNIITSIMFALLFNSFGKFLKQKSSLFILLIGLLLVNSDMFAQGYTWLAGSITYLYPTSLIVIYFSYIYFKNDKYSVFDYILLTFLHSNEILLIPFIFLLIFAEITASLFISMPLTLLKLCDKYIPIVPAPQYKSKRLSPFPAYSNTLSYNFSIISVLT